jgi:prolyl-tRNA editing enzyme YbaK/EbsC (Cys-tRNA(Pro) deacylase)
MWPEPVERIAAQLRRAGIEGRLEELPAGVDSAPDGALRAEGFECDGRPLVALIPVERALDRDKLAIAARCRDLRPADVPSFPFRRTRVFVDSSVLTAEIAWIEAGSPRHVLGLPPAQLNSLAKAQPADLLLED